MENFLENIFNNPLYTFLAGMIILLIVYSFVKKFLKLIVFSVAALIIYLGYLAYTGQDIPITREQFIRHSTEQIEKFKSGASEKVKESGRDALREMIKEETEKQ